VAPRSEQIERALRHLRREPVLRGVMRRVGPYRLKLKPDRFATLCHSIVAQQVSGKAAQAMLRRLQDLVGPDKLCAATVSRLSLDELRSAGLSRQKAAYLHDLCHRTASGEVRLSHLGRMTDEEAIAELTRIKGVGRWTAEMLLIFSLGRLDVLPCDDYGIRSAIQRLYQLETLPDRSTCLEIAQPWRPYASVASWYCWRSLELPDGK